MHRRTIALVLAFLALLAASATAATSAIHVSLTQNGPQITGPRTWQAGWQRVSITSHAQDQELTLLHFRDGYTYAAFLADGKISHGHTPAAHAALRRIFARTVFEGGADLFSGQSATVAFHVAPGSYYLGEMTSRPQLVPIRVSGARAAPTRTTGTISATDSGFRVSSPLPADGSITIRNLGRHNHRVNLMPVKPGTTRAQLGSYLRTYGASDHAPAPPFAVNGPQIGTADLSAGVTMQLGYKLPAGAYAVIDFDQDPLTGHRQALDGLYTIVTLH